MPIALTNPWKAGSVDGEAEYSQAKIVDFSMCIEGNPHVMISVEFGDTVDGSWVPGKTGHFQVVIQNDDEGAAYSDFVIANQALVDSVAAVLYAKLQDLEPVKAAGTTV